MSIEKENDEIIDKTEKNIEFLLELSREQALKLIELRELTMKFIEFSATIKRGFDNAIRIGSDIDEPEGNRYITISDTMAKSISSQIRDLMNLNRKYRIDT